MKLKKIASLMLAGVMAVSMLAGCSNASNDQPNPPTDPVEPVDSSFAADVNDLLSSSAKNTLTLSSDNTLATVLDKVANELSGNVMVSALANDGWVIGSDARDFRHLLGINRDNGLTSYTANGNVGYTNPFDSSIHPYGDRNAITNKWGTWNFFKNNTASATTTADLIVIPGHFTEEGVAEVVADAAEELIGQERLPLSGTANGNKYRYEYTGDIACVKIVSLSGDTSSYVVGITLTQTPVQVKNG